MEKLKGKQSRGEWSYDPAHKNGFSVWSSFGGDTSCVVDDADEHGNYGGVHREADAALIAQAGTVANRTGYWPLEMERRDEILTRAMSELMAVVLTEPISETVKLKKMAEIVQGCSDELRGISHGA